MSSHARLILPSRVLAADALRVLPGARPNDHDGDGPCAAPGRGPAPEEPWGPDEDLDDLIDAINANFVAEVRASLDQARSLRPTYPA
jgi:hypothetical protein